MPGSDRNDIEEKLILFRQTVAELGKEQAILKLAKQYGSEETSFLMDQLSGREVARDKFPFLASKDGIRYPPAYYLEQTSSERTARFKAELVHGRVLIDITGGFGVDTYFFSEKMQETWYVEQDPVIFEIASSNFRVLNPVIKTVCGDSLEFLNQFPKKADWIFVDPLRRSKQGRLKKVEEYSPNIFAVRDQLFAAADNVMIKLSPMTDITQMVRSFGNQVREIYVLAINNECKELLVTSDGGTHLNPRIESINWRNDKEERFVSKLADDTQFPPIPQADPMALLYEPNAAIFKAQQYDSLARKHSLYKLHPNTHIYTSDDYIEDYPGKIYKVKATCAFDARALKGAGDSFNIKTRNFPMDSSAVAKKLGIREGGDDFLFCVKLRDEKLRVIVAELVA